MQPRAILILTFLAIGFLALFAIIQQQRTNASSRATPNVFQSPPGYQMTADDIALSNFATRLSKGEKILRTQVLPATPRIVSSTTHQRYSSDLYIIPDNPSDPAMMFFIYDPQGVLYDASYYRNSWAATSRPAVRFSTIPLASPATRTTSRPVSASPAP